MRKKFYPGDVIYGVPTRWSPSTETLEVYVDGWDKKAFVPKEELSIYSSFKEGIFPRLLAYIIGKNVQFEVSEVGHSLFLSRRKLANEMVQEIKTALDYGVDQFVIGTVTNVFKTHVFIDVSGLSGICHISNLTYARIPDSSWIVSPGDIVKVKVLDLDESNHLTLSLKQGEGTLSELLERVEVGSIMESTILSRVNPSLDTDGKVSYFMMYENGIMSGIVDIPQNIPIAYGDKVVVCILKKSERGIRASFISKS